MGRTLGLAIAGVLLLVGGVWTGQGLGYVEGSVMTGERTWAILGPIVAGLGVALGLVVIQRSREGRQ